MTTTQRAEVRALIAFYERRGWDWSDIVEFTIRRFHGSLPWQEAQNRKKRK